MFIDRLYAGVFQQLCKHEICTTALFLSQTIKWTKYIVSPLVQDLREIMSSRKLGPCCVKKSMVALPSLR